MKTLMKIWTILLSIILVILILNIFGVNFGGDILGKIILSIISSLIPIVAIAISCKNLVEENNNFFKFTIVFMMLMIVLDLIIACTSNTSTYLYYGIDNSDSAGVLSTIKNFLSPFSTIILLVCLILNVKTNNNVSRIIQSVSTILCIIVFITIVVLMIINGVDSAAINLFAGTILNIGNGFLMKVYLALYISLLFGIILLYIANYAFQIDIDIDKTINNFVVPTLNEETSVSATSNNSNISENISPTPSINNESILPSDESNKVSFENKSTDDAYMREVLSQINKKDM